jgi:hypothetical protein
MPKSFGFHVVECTEPETFKSEIKKHLEDGWELHGNMIAFPDPAPENNGQKVRYIQAVIKEIRADSGLGFRRSI